MPDPAFAHFVFVDFENVPDVDLGLVEGKPVHVTLLIGKNQKKLDLTLVRQIHRLASQVELVEVGATGRNALDLTLAFYLGQSVHQRSSADFHIVSKDQDFDPMIGHLVGRTVKVARCEAFHLLPFLPRPKPVAPVKPSVPAKAAPAPKKAAPEDRLTKLIESFKRGPAGRPKKRAGLRHRISAAYGNKVSDAELTEIVASLEKGGIVSIDAQDKVSYAAAR